MTGGGGNGADWRPLLDGLLARRSLSVADYEALAACADPALDEALARGARDARAAVYGDAVFARGLIEFTNVCRNDCLYCGLRRSNAACRRYRLTREQILACAREGRTLGFRTFVLQGGEDPFWDDARLCALVRALKAEHPDCAVTLSVGERPFESYRALREAGADRYLLRHETATPAHYARLHPPELSWENRMRCLRDLRALGYQVGCGFMVGSPFQTASDLARDLKFVEEFKPEMCGIGPFVPHRETPFAHEPAGSAALTCRLLSIIRLIHPPVLLPATTALGTVDPRGREKGLLAGANVVMPNLSPVAVRKDYDLYDNKICTGEESAQCRGCLARRIESVGLRLVEDRGDFAGSTPDGSAAACDGPPQDS